jgi:predicted TPR repeat methyltransferase
VTRESDWKAAVERGLVYAFDDRLAPHYERHLIEECSYATPDVVADVMAEVVTEARDHRAERWLDIGAGTGLVGKAVARRGVAIELVALDVSEPMLGLIDCPCYVERVIGNASISLPFDDGSFDGVVAAGLLEHIVDPAPLFRKAARALRPAGHFAFTFPPNTLGRAELWDSEEGLMSHDPTVIGTRLAAAGLSVTLERDYPAYTSGSKGWVTHHLVAGVEVARGSK